MRCRPTLWFSNDGTFSYSRDHLRSGCKSLAGTKTCCSWWDGLLWALGADPGLGFQGSRAQTVQGGGCGQTSCQDDAAPSQRAALQQRSQTDF